MADAGTDLLIIGAGAVGLAIARKAALSGRDVILVETNDSFGMETSSRNSEVIHAGIYYPEDSLKGQLCVKGALAMYEFCNARGITTKNYGKLIVATDEDQIEGLEHVVKGTMLHCLNCGLRGAIGGHENDQRTGCSCPEVLQGFDSRDPAHSVVQKDEIRGLFTSNFNSLLSRVCSKDGMSVLRQNPVEGVTNLRIVINKENGGLGRFQWKYGLI